MLSISEVLSGRHAVAVGGIAAGIDRRAELLVPLLGRQVHQRGDRGQLREAVEDLGAGGVHIAPVEQV